MVVVVSASMVANWSMEDVLVTVVISDVNVDESIGVPCTHYLLSFAFFIFGSVCISNGDHMD